MSIIPFNGVAMARKIRVRDGFRRADCEKKRDDECSDHDSVALVNERIGLY